MRPIVEEARETLDGLRPESTSPGLVKLTLVGIVTKVATALLKDAASSEGASKTDPHSRTERDAIENPRTNRDNRSENAQPTFKHS